VQVFWTLRSEKKPEMEKMAPNKKSNPNSFYLRRKNEKIENKDSSENHSTWEATA